MNITYTQNGDYLIPNIVIRKTKPLGHYGRLRKAYLEMRRPILFNELVLSDKLFEHCAEIDEAARNRMELIVPKLAKQYGVTEQLKAENQMEWVRLFARRTRYIGILTDDPQALEELQEEIYEEYGFLIETGSDIRKLHLPDGDRGLLLVSGADLRLIKPAALPHNCVWLYTMTEGSEAGRLCSGLHDAYYLDIYSAWKKM